MPISVHYHVSFDGRKSSADQAVAIIVAENPGCFFKGGTSGNVVNRMQHVDYSKAIRVYQVADCGENNVVVAMRESRIIFRIPILHRLNVNSTEDDDTAGLPVQYTPERPGNTYVAVFTKPEGMTPQQWHEENPSAWLKSQNPTFKKQDPTTRKKYDPTILGKKRKHIQYDNHTKIVTDLIRLRGLTLENVETFFPNNYSYQKKVVIGDITVKKPCNGNVAKILKARLIGELKVLSTT